MSILRARDFRLLWLSETVSMVGSAASVVLIPLAAIALGASPTVLGVLTACAWLPTAVLALPAGAWVDQTSRRTVMLAANLASAAVFATIPAAAWLGVLTLAHLVVAALAGGVAAVFFRLAFQAYLPTVVPSDRLVAANAWVGKSEAASELVGPSAAGVLAQVFTAAAAVVLDAASFVFAAACLWRIRTPENPQDRRSNEGLGKRIRDGLQFVFADPFLRPITVFVTLVNLTQAAMQTLLVAFLVSTVGVSAGVAGVLMAGMGAGGLLGAQLVDKAAARFGTARTMLWGEVATVPFAVAIPLTAAGPRLALFVVGLLGVFAGLTAGSIVARSFRQGYVPRNMLGGTGATMTVFGRGAIPVGALAGGALATAIGIRPALWVACAALLAPVLVLVFSPIRGRRDLPTRAGDAEKPAAV